MHPKYSRTLRFWCDIFVELASFVRNSLRNYRQKNLEVYFFTIANINVQINLRLSWNSLIPHLIYSDGSILIGGGGEEGGCSALEFRPTFYKRF
jgi:hypothetical protein